MKAFFRKRSVLLSTGFLTLAAGVACGRATPPTAVLDPLSAACAINPFQPVRALEQIPSPIANPVRSDYKPGELQKACQNALSSARSSIEQIVKLYSQERSIDNTLLALEGALAHLSERTSPLSFLRQVSPSQLLRDEAGDCESAVAGFTSGLYQRRDLYDALRDALPRNEAEGRLHAETIKLFESRGTHLQDYKRTQIASLFEELASTEARYLDNLENSTTNLAFERRDLTGLPKDYLDSLQSTPDGRFLVPTSPGDYLYVMQNASSANTRWRLMQAYNNRGYDRDNENKNNVALLEHALSTRQRIAELMGFANWAEYRIRGHMAGDLRGVSNFLDGLKTQLAKRNRQDLSRLIQFKRELDASGTDVRAWDTAYLGNQLKRLRYRVDEDRINPYFRADTVVAGVMDVYSKLLGIRFVELTETRNWAGDVKFYEIQEARDGTPLAYFYADLYPRVGKYGRTTAFPILQGRTTTQGYVRPVSALVANLSPPINGVPSTLDHGDVLRLFHEFAHLMHQTLTRVPYASLSGANVDRDFAESPAQMLENWAWSPEVLASLSGRNGNLCERLPSDLARQISAAKEVEDGLNTTRQLYFALLDVQYHSSNAKGDTTETAARLHREILSIEPIPGSHPQAAFGHLMSGYDAGYYSYLWSEVYAKDLYSKFENSGLLNPRTGMEFRRMILERGNMEDGLSLIRSFLGRDPGPESFFRSLKI